MESSDEDIYTVIKLERDKLVASIKDNTLSDYIAYSFADAMGNVVNYIGEEIEAGNLPTPENPVD